MIEPQELSQMSLEFFLNIVRHEFTLLDNMYSSVKSLKESLETAADYVRFIIYIYI